MFHALTYFSSASPAFMIFGYIWGSSERESSWLLLPILSAVYIAVYIQVASEAADGLRGHFWPQIWTPQPKTPRPLI